MLIHYPSVSHILCAFNTANAVPDVPPPDVIIYLPNLLVLPTTNKGRLLLENDLKQ